MPWKKEILILQNTPVIQDGTGIRCRFDKVTVKRKGQSETRTDYSPVKEDNVAQK